MQVVYYLVILFIACAPAPADKVANKLVHNIDEFNMAVKEAEPGDEIILANGEWNDAELKFYGNGTEANPILLRSETPGQVKLTGQSNLRLAGRFLIVKGLVFTDGYTPTSEVISYKKSKNELCYDCRVTECVIDNYNNPERFENDLWVGIYGKRNRFDHNYIVGKRNQGVTVAVRLNSEESIENFHRIDHNYFGPRPILGSNGGETLRIGTSHYSMKNSNTIVEFNYFDRCNGEHEIISNKSGQNIFRNNTFFECQGTLTMRHGNETLVENNYFFGNGKANTGGIRIINEKQTVRNNYCEGLTGYRFRGALVIMNGVPDSPLNRYFQVVNSEASHNTFIDCDYIQLCAGSDEERSATPLNTAITNNIFYNQSKDDMFTVYDDVSGIQFQSNVVSENIQVFTDHGFEKKTIQFVREDGILKPKEKLESGCQDYQDRARKENCGVSWYKIEEQSPVFGGSQKIKISPSDNILEIFNNVQSGDILELSPGKYVIEKSLDITSPVSIIGIGTTRAEVELYFERSSLFNIENGGALQLKNLVISGKESPDRPGNSVIRTSRYSMTKNYKLSIENCDFVDLDNNHSFDVLKIYKNTFADSIKVINSNFKNITGHVFALDKEYEDLGIYNVENMLIHNCRFEDIEGSAINLYRGGGDESTFGPILEIDGSTFINVGKGKRNKTGASVRIHGVQLAEMVNNVFESSSALDMHLSVGEPVITLKNIDFSKSAALKTNSKAYSAENIIN